VKKPKKSRRKKLLIWLAIDVAAAVIIVSLLHHRPAGYHPVLPPAGADPNEQRVHRYLTHDLGNKLYNGAQRQQPFELTVLEDRLNEALAQAGWLQESAGIQLSAPAIAFKPGRVVLMGTADVQGAGFVVTIELGPQIMEDGRLNLVVEKVKVGAMNITWPAQIMGSKMYRQRLDAGEVDPEDWRTKIAASLFAKEPFDPVLLLEDKWIRLERMDVRQGELLLRFVPAKEPQ
jgi:hypothetical protein